MIIGRDRLVANLSSVTTLTITGTGEGEENFHEATNNCAEPEHHDSTPDDNI